MHVVLRIGIQAFFMFVHLSVEKDLPEVDLLDEEIVLVSQKGVDLVA